MAEPPPRWFAFLRAINIANRRVRMEALRGAFEDLGFGDVETYIASGNVVFRAAGDAAELTSRVEAHLEGVLGYPVPTFLRDAKALRRLASRRPFDDAPEAQVNVAFLRAPLTAATRRALADLGHGALLAVHGAHVFWHTPDGMAASPVSWGLVEKAIGQATTVRGLATVRRMAKRWPPD